MPACVRQCSRNLLSKLRKGSEWIDVARGQLSAAMLDYGSAVRVKGLRRLTSLDLDRRRNLCDA